MYLSKVDLPLHSDHALLDFFAFAQDFFVFACQVSLLSFFFFICLLYSILTKEIESNTLDLCSGRGSCGSFVHVDLESNTLDLGFGANITHLIQRTRRRRRNFFFCKWVWFCKQRWQQRGGFGFAVGVFGFTGDFTEWVWFCRGSLLLLLLLLLSDSFFFFVLLVRFSNQ